MPRKPSRASQNASISVPLRFALERLSAIVSSRIGFDFVMSNSKPSDSNISACKPRIGDVVPEELYARELARGLHLGEQYRDALDDVRAHRLPADQDVRLADRGAQHGGSPPDR